MDFLQIIESGLAIVGVASVVASFTPTDKDDKFLAKTKTLLHTLAFNFGAAKNADPMLKKEIDAKNKLIHELKLAQQKRS